MRLGVANDVTCRRPIAPLSRVVAVALLLAALVLSACGKKGDPLPPLRNVPLTISDLTVSQQGHQILLDMGYPSTTVSGMVLGGIDAAELVVLTKPAPPPPAEGEDPRPLPSADAREMEAAGQSLVSLRGAELSSAVVGDRLQIRLPLADPLPAEPVVNIFAVRTVKGDETSAVSNRVSLVPITPPGGAQQSGGAGAGGRYRAIVGLGRGYPRLRRLPA